MIDVKVSGFKEISEVLSQLAQDDTLDEISDAAATLFKSDILEWINAGNAFKQRTGNLFASVQEDLNMQKGIAEIMTGGNKAFYAAYVEFGTGYSKPYPFFYADMDNRFKRIMDMAQTIIAGKINQ